ncbi:MAG: T9SS type A sorting domain-containing protein [Candidatus Kapabacteria bacterium]|nr:T9SS type A sorting domain-containing protein [Candidatus Kapabacteria bacterium]
MKRFFYTLLVMVVFPALVYSQGLFLNEASTSPAQNHMNESELLQIIPEVSYDKQLAPFSQGKFKEIGITIDLIFNTYYSGVTPFVYEPNSGTLIYVQTDRIRVPEGSDSAALTGIVRIYTSQDGGNNWQTHEIYRKWGSVPVNASIAVLNPNNETNPANFKYVISTRHFELVREMGQPDDYAGKGGLFLLYEGNNFSYIEYPEAGPLSNNPGTNQLWSMTNMTASSAKGGNHFYSGGLLTPANNFIQYGYYGFGYIELETSDVGSSIPPQFNYDQFKPSSGGLGSSFTSQMNLDVDAQGNVYAAVNNHFKPNTDDPARVVGVSKSADNGKSFSEFNKMSLSIIEDFVSFKGGSTAIGSAQPGLYPYASNGFRVTAEDEYSFIYRIFSWASTESGAAFIVEAFRKDGQWGMREISTFNGHKWRIPYVIQDTNAASAPPRDEFFNNSRQQEVQLAITADGQYLIAKWMDNRDNLVKLETPQTLVGGGVVDSMLTTDIFYSYRAVNGTQWSPAYNLTDDVWMNKGTWIPNIVPSINQIPIIEHATVRFTNPANPRLNYPYFMQNYVVQASIRNHILVATFDGLNPGNIRNEQIQIPEGVAGASVDEENYNFRVFNMNPNPVDNEGYINYQLDAPGHVTIDIHNSLGQKVMNVRNAFTDQGLWQANFSASELPSGAYFYTLTFNGKSVTKTMHIAR